MKKIVVLFIFLVFGIMPVCAQTIKVKSLSDFNTENPSDTLTVEAVTDLNLDNEIVIFEGYKLKGNIVDVISPKRLKRDATFSFILTEYTDRDGIIHKVDSEDKIVKGKFTTKFDYKEVAKSAALSVGNYFVKGLSMGYAAIEGAVKNEEDNRIKSSAVSVYESTPLSYVEKGMDIFIAKDQIFMLNFKLKDEEEDVPNYEYTLPSQENDYVEKTTGVSENINNENERKINQMQKSEKNKSEINEDNDAVEYEEFNGFHLRRRTKKYPPEMEDQAVPDTQQPMAVPDPQNTKPLAPLDLPDTY